MFGIMSNGKMDQEMFNEIYLENKEILDSLVFYMEQSLKLLEVKLDELGYDKVQELKEFLDNCEANYTVINLMASLEGFLEKKEDEVFLDLYMAIQDDKLDEWLKDCDMSKINMLYRNFKEDETVALLFPDIRDYVLEKEKSLHR